MIIHDNTTESKLLIYIFISCISDKCIKFDSLTSDNLCSLV